MNRLGVVSFLNARPLIEGLEERRDIELVYDVPARLPALLDAGRVDAALIPVVDVLRSAGKLRVVSDACIGCDGETLTVRIFSQVPPDRIHVLHVDGDSHTSIALATVMWRQLYERNLELKPLRAAAADDCQSVLLIGDKVVRPRRTGFAYEVDLGAAWRQHTGLPFVFAVWAAPNADLNLASPHALFGVLGEARDRGLARGKEIAEREGPARWWPVDLAVRYLTRSLKYRLDARYIEGANLFARLCVEAGIAPPAAEVVWPAELLESSLPAAGPS